MAMLQLTVISAVFSDAELDCEPRDIFAIVKFGKEQRRTKIAYDHGKSPVWNETLTFTFNDQNYSKFLFVQLFQSRPDADELLGVSRISVPTSGEIESSLHVLVSPSRGEIGTLKATGRWESICQESGSLSSSTGTEMAKNTRDDISLPHPFTPSNYDDITSSFSNLAVGERQKKEQYPAPFYPPVTYPPQSKAEELTTSTSSPYPPPGNGSRENNRQFPYPPNLDAYPPYLDYTKSSSSLDWVYGVREKEEEGSSNVTTRGLDDTVNDRGHHFHSPSGHLSLPMHEGGYPPRGYPPPHGYHSQYGHPLPGYTPPPTYPQAPYQIPSSPYGYPPAVYPYPPPSHPYPPHGYPPQMPYSSHSGHGSYAPGMYVGHSSSGKHDKHHKHHEMKMPKHSIHYYGHGYAKPHPKHGYDYKHKKDKKFGKGKFKKFKGFQ